MTTPATESREVLDRLAGSTVYVGGGEYSADALVPAPFAALRAVLDELDFLDNVDLFAGPAHRLREVITTALEGP